MATVAVAVSIKRVCRTCMSMGSAAMVPLFDGSSSDEHTIGGMLRLFTMIKASPTDGLPQFVCVQCLSEINQAILFKNKCERSEKSWQSYRLHMNMNRTNAGEQKPTLGQPKDPEPTTAVPDEEERDASVAVFPAEVHSEEMLSGPVSIRVEPEDEDELDTDDEVLSVDDNFKPVHDDTYSISSDETDIHAVGEQSTDENERLDSAASTQSPTTARITPSSAPTSNTNTEDDRLVKCTDCSRTFRTDAELQKHRSDGRSCLHSCKYCNKRFRKYLLLNHLRMHTGERPFSCTVCGKEFARKEYLRRHMLHHQQVKEFQCPECPKVFLSQHNLDRHMHSHTGAKPFVCEVCNAGFTFACSLTRHRNTHTDDRPYACQLCPMRFSILVKLLNHQRTHAT